jgi:UrcA family protein
MSHFIKASAARPRARLTLLIAGAVGCVMAAGAASAGAVGAENPSRVVQYSPESLATDSGVHALYRRIVSAADAVCPQPSSFRWVSDAVQACRQQAIARAVQQINNPHLAALYAGSSKSG